MASPYRGVVLPLILATLYPAAFGQSPAVRAVLQPPSSRKPAPSFRLPDAAARVVSLSGFKGKVVLLDFWATECGGCRIEIPWYMEFDRKYRTKGLGVVGVSMDVWFEQLKSADEGWMKVRPFVRKNRMGYSILMGDESVGKAYDIMALPITALIDKKGRVAATYANGLADKNDVEANIRALLKER